MAIRPNSSSGWAFREERPARRSMSEIRLPLKARRELSRALTIGDPQKRAALIPKPNLGLAFQKSPCYCSHMEIPSAFGGEPVLSEFTVRPVSGAGEQRRRDALAREHHYLPFHSLFGKSLRHVAVWGEVRLALSGWTGAPSRSARGMPGSVYRPSSSSRACI